MAQETCKFPMLMSVQRKAERENYHRGQKAKERERQGKTETHKDREHCGCGCWRGSLYHLQPGGDGGHIRDGCVQIQESIGAPTKQQCPGWKSGVHLGRNHGREALVCSRWLQPLWQEVGVGVRGTREHSAGLTSVSRLREGAELQRDLGD